MYKRQCEALWSALVELFCELCHEFRVHAAAAEGEEGEEAQCEGRDDVAFVHIETSRCSKGTTFRPSGERLVFTGCRSLSRIEAA